ncbi:SAM-dependent methyltransferase [Puniceicoccus vermicola]|uniref:Tetrapyrrole methylase domain-containing protein n=1 Tax=Puniceicoccus vermicola TaxID=388746 RepID=A0A7X1AZK2_9BACT|nr:SAM-dependent methyltransferase [Puniceicoccus vermicola]MBC2602876.1 hypothetical protein [Puniceicoccus vermicola]
MKLQTVLNALDSHRLHRAPEWDDSLRTILIRHEADLVLLDSPPNPQIWKEGIDGFIAVDGTLCFRHGDPLGIALRQLFVHCVTFVGAAPSLKQCTLEAIEAIEEADVCLHDTLFDPSILRKLKPGATLFNVGKRCGKHAVRQSDINRLILNHARMGLRVARLKAGDPGIYGRLCEETDALTDHGLPFHVQPAVSSLSVATTGSGLLLTRRGCHRGFTVMTPRCAGGVIGELNPSSMDLPIILFMASHIVRESIENLRKNGLKAHTPAAIIYDAGTPSEEIIEGTVETLPDIVDQLPRRTGLVYLGEGVTHGLWPKFGPLAGEKFQLPDDAPDEVLHRLHDLGGSRSPNPEAPMILDLETLEALALRRFVRNLAPCAA